MSRAAVVALAILGATPAFADDPVVSATTATQAADYDAEIAAETARLDAERRKLESIEAGQLGDATGGTSYPLKVLEMFFVLGAVCFLAYFLLGRVLPRMLHLSPAAMRNMTAIPPRGLVEVVDRLPLDPKRSVVVLKVGSAHFLVGMTEQNMEMLSRLDESELGELPKPEPPPPIFGSRFQKLLDERFKKTG